MAVCNSLAAGPRRVVRRGPGRAPRALCDRRLDRVGGEEVGHERARWSR